MTEFLTQDNINNNNSVKDNVNVNERLKKYEKYNPAEHLVYF
jgi:hypothetical protein